MLSSKCPRARSRFSACLIAVSVAVCGLPASSGELAFSFNSPAFSGAGYSQHVLSVEQLSYARKQAVKADAEAAEQAAAREAQSTNLARFLNNVESRIFATLSKRLVDDLFDGDGVAIGVVEIEGNTINFEQVGEELKLSVLDANGDVTTLTIPVGAFNF